VTAPSPTKSSLAGKSATSCSRVCSNLRTYAALADAFVSLFERASRAFPRLRGIDDGFEVTPPDLLAGVTTALLANAYLRGIEEKPVPVIRLNHVTVDAVSVAETVVSLSQRLPSMGRLSFRTLTEVTRRVASRSSCTSSRS
jgi:segregation and condensation protein A